VGKDKLDGKPPRLAPLAGGHSGPDAHHTSPALVTTAPLQAFSAPIDNMSLADLNFDRAQDFTLEVWKKWGVTINFEAGKDQEEFLLVAEFTRSQIRLTEESVSTILLACFGGRASLFKVKLLQNWSFKFSVSSKEVGFSIIKGGNISLPLLNVNSLLWGNGGPNSCWELDRYLQEKEDEWTHVFRRHPRKSYMQALRSPAIYNTPNPSDPRSTPVHPSLSNGSPSSGNQGHIHGNNGSNMHSLAITNHSVGSLPIQNNSEAFCVRCLLTGHLGPTAKIGSNVVLARDGAI
jgi:hypothetical protein